MKRLLAILCSLLLAGAFSVETTIDIDEFIQRALKGSVEVPPSLETHATGILRFQEMIESNSEIAVYKFLDDRDREYVVKISRKYDLSQDRQRVLDYRQYDLPHADYFEGDARYSIREFISGERGDEFIERWEKNGGDKNHPKMKKLYGLVIKMLDEVFYFDNLGPQNMVWSDAAQDWAVINSGSLQKFKKPEEVKRKILSSFGRQWFASPPMSIPSSTACIVRLNRILSYWTP